MPLFRRSKDKERKEYINYLQKMASTCELLIKYSESTDHVTRVEHFADEVRYFIPFDNEDIKVIDKKIKNVLDDLKILLYTNRDPYRVKSKIDEVETLIKERSSKV